MAHNPYHIDQVYDYNKAGTPQASDTLNDVGYNFKGSEYEKYFDKYDPTGEQFATQGNALNQAFQNQQFGSATTNFQDQLSNLSRNTPFSGFSKSGGMERGLNQARSNIMRGYDDMRNQHLFNQSQGDLALQQDIFGMRKDYKDDTRRTLIDLLKSGADLDKYKGREATAEEQTAIDNWTKDSGGFNPYNQ